MYGWLSRNLSLWTIISTRVDIQRWVLKGGRTKQENSGCALNHTFSSRTKMTEQEKYLEDHRNCGIKVGDRVRVTRKAEDGENGWNNSWAGMKNGPLPGMDAYIGVEGEVVADLDDYGFGIKIEDCEAFGYAFPYFILEKI